MTLTHRVVPTPPVRSGQAGHTRGRCNDLSSFVVLFTSPNATRNKRRHAAPALSASRMHSRSITSPRTPSGRSRSVTSLLEALRRSHRASSAASALFSLESHSSLSAASTTSSTTLVLPTNPGYPSCLNAWNAVRVRRSLAGGLASSDRAAAAHSAARHPERVPTSTDVSSLFDGWHASRHASFLASLMARRISWTSGDGLGGGGLWHVTGAGARGWTAVSGARVID